MIAALLVAVQVAADSMPLLDLNEALERAARVDPGYVAALGQVGDAAWARRAAYAALILPAVTATTDATRFSTSTFNIGTGRPQETIVSSRIEARWDLFVGGQRLAEVARSRAEVESAQAGELAQRFTTALLTERDYYAVLAAKELTRVAQERVARAEEQLGVARARVVSGAAVQTDSLELRLELTRARVTLLELQVAQRVAHLQFGRRIGLAGPADALPIGVEPPGDLPIALDEAIREALEQGPQYRVARADERAAAAAYRSTWSGYLPRASLVLAYSGFDDRFLPSVTTRTQIGVQLSWSLWDNGRRELTVSRARSAHAVARAIKDDLERSAYRDVTFAYDAYNTARASAALEAEAVDVARESFRVQETRYRAGATTILDLLTAQVAVSAADAALVQSRYATWLALAGLEALIGRRLYAERSLP